MTDAERVRRLAQELDEVNADQRGVECAPIYPGDPELLLSIASLLDAIPPETLAAIKEGTWKAVPVEPTKDELERLEFTYLCWLHPGARDYASSLHGVDLASRMRRTMLSAAPTKPEE